MGCTNCKGKTGCDHRKGAMMASVDQALARLYPTRTWGEPDDREVSGMPADELAALADELASTLGAATFVRTGGDDEPCDYIYVLCMGRTPCIVQVRDHGVPVPAEWHALGSASDLASWGGDPTGQSWALGTPTDLPRRGEASAGSTSEAKSWGVGTPTALPAGRGAAPVGSLHELYLRLVVSQRVRVAAVQQVAVELVRAQAGFLVREQPRAGVYDAPLLHRMQKLVATLPGYELLHVDFGEIAHAPPGYHAGTWRELFGGEPSIANYLFYPQPTTMIATGFVAEPRR